MPTVQLIPHRLATDRTAPGTPSRVPQSLHCGPKCPFTVLHILPLPLQMPPSSRIPHIPIVAQTYQILIRSHTSLSPTLSPHCPHKSTASCTNSSPSHLTLTSSMHRVPLSHPCGFQLPLEPLQNFRLFNKLTRNINHLSLVRSLNLQIPTPPFTGASSSSFPRYLSLPLLLSRSLCSQELVLLQRSRQN